MATTDRKKVAQHELRRIMSEQKRKLLVSGKKVDSPLAKYKEDGTLTCIVCESIVRSDAVWTVHINSKQHKENIVRKKQMLAPPKTPPPPPPKHIFKRPLNTTDVVPPKKIKGILKNAPSPKLPEGFFDSGTKNRPVPPAVAELKEEAGETPAHSASASRSSDEPMDEESEAGEGASGDAAEPLPEGFFDDPFMDAKARNVEYKDPIQEEWERFQKEIKEETTVSTQIIEDDQEEATAERQIQEIDEQLRNWSRVLDLEKRKETVQSVTTKVTNGIGAEDASDEDEEFDEFLDWRAKKSFK